MTGRVLIGIALLGSAFAAIHARANVNLPGDGTNTVLQQGIANLPIGDDSRSFIAWIKVSSIPANGEALAGYGSINPFGGYHRSALDIDADGQVDMQFQVGYVVSTGVHLTTGSWMQVAGTYSSTSGVLIYVNGQPVPTSAGVNGFNPGAVDTININNNAITFGYEYSVTNGFTDVNTTGLEFAGYIAADSVWNRALSSAEILADYDNEGVPTDTSGLIAQAFGTIPASSSVLPEPSSTALLSLGLAVLCFVRTGYRSLRDVL